MSAVGLKKPMPRGAPIRVSIDLETTGLQAETDNIIEIAAVKFRGAEVLGRFQTFVATNRSIPFRVQRLTGITATDLQDAPRFEAVAPSLSAFLGKAPLVGHSVPFDAAFLRRRGLVQENPLIDTFELATVLLPALPSYTLERVAEALDVQSDVFHRAMADAVLAKDVLLALLARIEQLESSVLEELARLSGRLSWPLLSLFADERRARGAGRSTSKGGASVGEQWAAKLGLNPQVFALGIARPASVASNSPASSDQPSALPSPGLTEVAPDERAKNEPPRAQTALDAALAGAFEATRPLLLEIEPDAESLSSSLLSAICWAQEQRRPLVIAAANAGTCRRLMQETLPTLQANLPRPPRVEFLVEPEKYLCLHRWFGGGRLPRNGRLPADITRGLAKLTLWLHYSASGIRDDLVLMPQEQAAWEMVRAGPEYLNDLSGCHYARHGYCFYKRARDAAATADVLVTTHAALLAYLSSDAAVLAKANHLLILDAHLLEEEALRQDGYDLNQPGIARLLDDLLTGPAESGSSGLLALAARSLGQGLAAAAGRGALPAEARPGWWYGPVNEARQALDRFFNALALLLAEYQAQHHGGPRSWSEGVEPSLRLQPKIRNAPAWKGVEQTWDELEKALLPLISRLERLITLLGGSVTAANGQQRASHSRKTSQASRLVDLQQTPSDESMALAEEINGVYFRLREWAEQGRLAITQPRGGMVYWVRPPLPPPPPRAASGISATPPDDAPPARPTLHAAPVHAGPLLQRTVFRADRAAALVSSALRVNGEFDYIAERLGLAAGRATTLSVAPENQPHSLLYLPDDVAEPNTHHYQRNLDAMLIQLATALNGETVALFASHAALRAGYAGVKAALEERGILVLAQGIDGSLRQLWQTFRSQERVALLGAVNSWDTVELPGERPACVVVTRLPFPALSDPPLAGRAELYHDQLHQYVIPQASLRLRQALNRLSWSGAGARATNGSESAGIQFPQGSLPTGVPQAPAAAGARRNAIVLFDKRVQAKDYGAVFLSSMPHCTVRQGSVSVLPEHVAGWIRGENGE
ncbi:MAG TPA: exonuclease domain-containing protein [Ktedonobacterales bacterium]|jgi:DNA polymerase III epsilon subunit family exonuclease